MSIESTVPIKRSDEKKPHEYWYYFGKCMPYPHKISEGMMPMPPYMRFETKKECKKYIDKLK